MVESGNLDLRERPLIQVQVFIFSKVLTIVKTFFKSGLEGRPIGILINTEQCSKKDFGDKNDKFRD